jgi:tRNA threonylcarbamoyladenosine biosynthesis protein TsaE
MIDLKPGLLTTEQDTLDWGAALAPKLPKEAFVVYLKGDLGAGKTTLVRGLLRALGHSGPVKSPTYTLVETYNISGAPVHHFDLYRMEHPEELEFIGGREYFDESLCLIEWPEKGEGWLPKPDLTLMLSAQGNARQITPQWQNTAT